MYKKFTHSFVEEQKEIAPRQNIARKYKKERITLLVILIVLWKKARILGEKPRQQCHNATIIAASPRIASKETSLLVVVNIVLVINLLFNIFADYSKTAGRFTFLSKILITAEV